ncbi:MAG TPA: UDP-N-acetylmuramoyl-L-alanine--D-glutamate ligase [Bauldia sp.]|nr:UDP-N-acetylmuramoyl-L-alanine--D-glutamate ligase [Bauldia sp.]
MIPVAAFSGKNVAVFGLGGSGRVTAAALIAGGARVAAWDDNGQAVEQARTAGLPVVDLAKAEWKSFVALVLSPGVPLTHPKPHWTVERAREAGIEVIGDVELFVRERRRNVPGAPFIAITGTNGKSTTTALIAHLIAASGRDAQLGGNIGRAILSLDPPRTGRYHVIECSSFQIDLAPGLAPSVGVLLNITPDHIDRHGTFENYAAIKERLVANASTAVIAVDDDHTQAVADRLERKNRRVVRVSARLPLARGVYADGGDLFIADAGASRRIASLAGIGSLRGEHNAQNAAAAVAAVLRAGVEEAAIQPGLRSFPGLPHRMEEVGRRGRVVFVNDSKATNADAAAKALASFDRIYWIAGGRQKEGGIAGLSRFFPRIAKAYLIGEAAEPFAETLGNVPHEMSGTLAAAIAAAARDASVDGASEPVVLLSPACASYDQFQNFEKRGDQFRALVRSLDGITRKGEAA